ncbi:hypothetical protein CLOP_g19016, partial [Closterium sp. NIES-67]
MESNGQMPKDFGGNSIWSTAPRVAAIS